jgi:hypothetical protein
MTLGTIIWPLTKARLSKMTFKKARHGIQDDNHGAPWLFAWL